MKVEELRIGNLVQNKYGVCALRYGKHTGELWLETEEGEESHEGMNPIPLTEEWLVKFGFEKYTAHHYYFCVLQRGSIHVYLETNFSNVSVELGNSFGQSFGYPKIKHVHQLQNLYFALTGTELTIKN